MKIEIEVDVVHEKASLVIDGRHFPIAQRRDQLEYSLRNAREPMTSFTLMGLVSVQLTEAISRIMKAAAYAQAKGYGPDHIMLPEDAEEVDVSLAQR